MSVEHADKQYTEQDFKDLVAALGDEEEARVIFERWNHKVPNIFDDGEKAFRDHLSAGSQAERERRDEMTDSSDWVSKLPRA